MVKKLEVDSLDQGNEYDLDFNFDDGYGFNPPKPESKSRSTVTSVLIGAGKESVKTAASPSFIKSTLSKALPKTFGEITEGVGEIATGSYELYDETVRELKPRLGRIAKKLDQLVPENSKFLKKATERLMQATGESRDTDYSSATNATEQNVVMTLGAIFDQNKATNIDERARTMVRDQIDKKRFETSAGVLSKIAQNTSIQAQYTVSVKDRFYRKTLELQLRGYLADKEHYSAVREWQRTSQAQLEAIVKNTSLPEYAKITASERFLEQGKNKFMSSLYGDGSVIKKGMERLKGTAREFVGGISRSLEMADFGLDTAVSGKQTIEEMNQMLVEMGEQPLSKAEMAGGMMAGTAMDFLQDVISKRLKKPIDKMPDLKNKLARGARMLSNPGAAISNLRESDKWKEKTNDYQGIEGKGYRALDFLLEHFMEQAPRRTIGTERNLDDLNSPEMGFDKRAHTSIVDVIPGYLSMIKREIEMLRTGADAQPMVYDYSKSEFTTRKDMGERLLKGLGKEARTGMHVFHARQGADALEGRAGFTEAQKSETQRFLGRLARLDNFDYTPENVRKTEAYQELSPKVKKIIDRRFSKMEKSTNKDERIHEFSSNVLGIRRSMPSLDKTMSGYVNAGYGDLLESKGLMKKSDKGDYAVDEEAFSKFIESESFVRSDINVKEAIKKMKPADLLDSVKERFQDARAKLKKSSWNPKAAFDGIKKTKLFNWQYQKGKGEPGEKSGPMAQELRQNLGEEAAPGGKAIDLQSMNGATMAAVQHLGDRVSEVEKETKPDVAKRSRGRKAPEVDVLSSIWKDTSAIVKILESGKGSGGGLAGGSRSKIKPDDYGALLGSLTENVVDLAKNVGQDVFGAATRMFNTGKDKVVKPTIDFVEKQYGKHKDTIKESMTKLFGKATELAGSALDFGKDVFSKHVPAGFKKLKDIASKAYGKVKDFMVEARDLYLPGGKKPIIQAIKSRAGFYRNSRTGEPIVSMDDLLKCKDDICDKDGNIILSVEEKATGLYDRYGERVKSFGTQIFQAAVGLAKNAKDRFMTGFNTLKEIGKDATKSVSSKLREKMKGFDGFGVGIGSPQILKDSHQVQVDIRSILLGDVKSVRDRLKKEGLKLAKEAAKATETGGGAESDYEVESKDDSGSNAPNTPSRSVGMFGNLRALGSKIKDTAVELKDKVTEKTAGTQEKVKGRLATWKDKLFNKAKQVKQANVPALLKSSPGLWNKVKSIGGSLGGRLRGLGGKGMALASGAMSILGGGSTTEDSSVAPGTPTAASPADKSNLQEGKEGVVKKKSGKGRVAAKDRAFNDTDGDGTRDGSVEDRDQYLQSLKESRKKKGAEADLSLKYKSEKNVLDQAGEKLGKLLDFAKTGLSSIFDMGTNLFSKVPGIGNALKGLGGKTLSAVTGLFKKGGLRAAASAGMNALRTGGGMLLRGGGAVLRTGVSLLGRAAITTATTAVPAIASTVASAAGGILGAIGSVLASPVVLGTLAVAAAGYGVWKLYKYASRDNAGSFELIRLRQYGFAYNKDVMKFNHHVYGLEAYLQDGRIKYDQGRAAINDKKVKVEEMLEFFDIDKEDAETAANFKIWFADRFKPVFLTHLTALFAQDPKAKLDDISSISLEKQIKYVQASAFPDGPYHVATSPVKLLPTLSIERDAIKAEVDLTIKKLQSRIPVRVAGESTAAKELDKLNEKKVEPPKDAVKSTTASPDAAAALRKQNEEAKAPATKTDAAAVTPVGPAGEDGPKPNIPSQVAPKPEEKVQSASAPSSLPAAPGNFSKGEGGMQYLRLGKNVKIDGITPALKENFLGMAEEYGTKTGKSIQVNDGLRTYEEQAAMYKAYPGKAAKPGRSLHEFGLALDINTADANALEELGLMRKYGFTRPVGGEGWHIEPAGIQRNLDLAKSDKTMRDTMISASLMHGGGGYGTVPGSTKSRRNHELAMKLLGTTSTLPKAKTEGPEAANTDSFKGPQPVTMKVPESKAPTSPSKPLEGASFMKNVGGSAVTSQPANDSNASFAKSDSQSTRNDLPPPEQFEKKLGGEATTPEAPKTAEGEVDKGKAWNEDVQGRKAQNGDPQALITDNARKVGVDPNMSLAFAAVESDMNPNARAPNTTAAGLFQFLSGTWNEQIGKYGSKHGLRPGVSPLDANASSLMGAEYIKQNQKAIGKVKNDPNVTDLYLAHFLGPGGARTFLKASPDAIAAQVMPDAAAKNKNIFYDKSGQPYTVRQVYDNISKKIKTKAGRYGVNVTTSELKASSETPKATEAASFNDTPAAKPANALQSSAAPAPVASSTAAPAAKPSNTSSGLYIGDRQNNVEQRQSVERGEGLGTTQLTPVVSALDKANEYHAETVKVLKAIQSGIGQEKIEELAKAIALAVGTAVKEGTKETPKEKDNANMGRFNKASGSSLDMTRKSA